MSNYSKVQFISWEINTGPFIAQTQPYQIGWYSGLCDPGPDRRIGVLGQCQDIDARLAFVGDAVNRAESLSERGADTLKIFMAPEFLFRGAGGAYLHDLILGWEGSAPAEFGLKAPYDARWGGLFGGLRALAADARFDHWLFVFGTAVSASFPTRREGGKELLDPTKPGEIYNTALIQRGGLTHGADNYVARKHYISGIDFLRWNGNNTLHADGTVLPLDPAAVIPADALGLTEGGALFQMPGVNDGAGRAIDFGIEICLDHACSGGNGANRVGRIRSAGKPVTIQLVPSGGMALKPGSVLLKPPKAREADAYAFNCDGLSGIKASLKGEPGSHTQLWSNRSADPALAHVLEANGGEAVGDTRLAPVATELVATGLRVPAILLWNNGKGVAGAGQVRVIKPCAL